MRIHIVEQYHSRAMRTMLVPLLNLSNIWTVTEGEKPDPSADVNIHIPWHSMIEYNGGKNIIMYTHVNPPDIQMLLQACHKADIVTCMSFAGRKELVEIGVDPKKIWVIYAAADNYKFSRRTIGIVGSPQPNGRKRESLLIDLAWKYSLAPFEFFFTGAGWDDTVQKLQSLGVAAACGEVNEGNLQSVYQQFDALLVTGYIEGGSLPILEAMTVGIPVISPKFGYACDLLDEHYETCEDLMTILENIAEKSVLNHQIARAWTWENYSAEYAMLIGRLMGVSSEIYSTHGMDRYTQILDVIDEIKPKSITEIGTWNGNRAIQMIQSAAKWRVMGDISYHGYDLFDEQVGEDYRREFSKIACPLSVVEKRIMATGAKIKLHRGNTKKTLKENLTETNLYFIDGGHSEDTVENDWREVSKKMLIDSVVIFDDYYHNGIHEGVGCNKIIDKLDKSVFRVTHLPVLTKAGDLIIGMVKVQYA